MKTSSLFHKKQSKNPSYALKRLKGIPIHTDLEEYTRRVQRIRSYRLESLTDGSLKARAEAFRGEALQSAESGDRLPEYFALTAEAVRRVLGLRVHDTQLVAAQVLFEGNLAQMRTGEGKTLSAVFAAAYRSLEGSGAHILTANEYLAQRDARWMREVYAFLGLSTGYVVENMTEEEKKIAYRRDITYTTVKQAGFDYLRDSLRYPGEERIQRPFYYCLVDEADFIMIDEARNPLVLAGETEFSDIDPERIDRVVRSLTEQTHFTLDRYGRNCFLTLEGQREVQRRLDCGGMHREEDEPLYAAVHVALQAHHLLHREVDYLVRPEGVILIDEGTGRVADRRRWPYGLQTALEVKEGLVPRKEGTVLSSVTVHHFLTLYPKLAAMTATAVSAAGEFKAFYGLDTFIIPPYHPEKKEDLPDLVFSTAQAKLSALIEEIGKVHRTGRPILVGTRTVKESAELSSLLDKAGIPHQVLNAKNDRSEAVVIARAGMLGAVTISTNMAGRGTDIRLGGPAGENMSEILRLGGLYVVGTNRHASVRIDNQLRGRAGRQGDPGASRFFISLEDDLVRRFAITDFIPRRYLGSDNPRPISDPRVAKEIARAQAIIEEQHFQMRTTLRRYSELLERQRRALVTVRQEALDHRLPPELLRSCGMEEKPFHQELGLLFLSKLDTFWRNHLVWVDELKEGIHLRRLGGEDPFLAFLKDASDAFEKGMLEVMRETAGEFLSPGTTSMHLKFPGGRPSSTWTYMINDNPFPNFRLFLLSSGGLGNPAKALTAMFVLPFALLFRGKKKKRNS
ncbi:MAG: hypothetical protein JW760_12295 [Spirochaetales bacterium]|nr:hypothetical protein [Spirochaetales bacterium]